MSESALQIIARGPRAAAEAAAEAIDADPRLEGATYSILEEDEDKGVWIRTFMPSAGHSILLRPETSLGSSMIRVRIVGDAS